MKEEARVSKYIRETRPAANGVGTRVDIKVLEDEGKGRIFLHRRNYNNGPDTVIPAELFVAELFVAKLFAARSPALIPGVERYIVREGKKGFRASLDTF